MDKEIEEIVKPVKKRELLTFLVFLVISSTLWLLIKLSKNYSTQTTFAVQYENAPADKCIASPETTVRLSFVTDGFRTLNHNMIRPQHRVVTIRLDEVPYQKESDNTYSISSQYVADKIASRLGITSADIAMDDAFVYFEMEDLQSKVVPVTVPLDVEVQRQYEIYGQPVISPSAITVFGPKEVIDTLTTVKTATLVGRELSASVQENLAIDFGGTQIHSNVNTVRVQLDVEQYTEADFQVPVSHSDSVQIRFFPKAVDVKCLVAVKDFSKLTADSFKVEADESGMTSSQPLLDVHLVKVPQNVKVLKFTPDKVEYLIVQ